MGLDAASRAPLPEKIGRYTVLGYLADGGMAEIFLGRENGRPVVIKRILPHLARQRTFVSMFIDEARIGSLVHHKNVVEIFELGQVGADLFMVMEYLAGENVSGLLRRVTARHHRLPFALGAHVIAEACAGLHAAHGLCDEEGRPYGLVHRDISPSNLFLTYGGEVKVLDFGIATAAHRLTQTSTGQVKGKFAYMSPEQCLGEPLDCRSDIFSLGVVLYELTTQRRLFKRPNELLVLKGVTEDPIPRPTREVADYPERLERIVMKALSRDRDRRHTSALELRNELLAVMTSLGFKPDPQEALADEMASLFPERIAEKLALVRHVRAGTDFGAVPAAEVDENVELPQVHPRVTTSYAGQKPRSRAGWIVLVALLVGAGVGAALWYRQQQQDVVAASPPAAPPIAMPAVAADAAPTPDASTRVVVHIESIPSGAELFVDDEKLGTTPFDLTLDNARDVTLRLQLAGHAPVTQQLSLDREQRLLIPLPALPPPTSGTAPAKKKVVKPKPKPQTDPFERFN